MGVVLHLITVESLYTKMFCAKFGWNWPTGSWEEDENVKTDKTDKTEKLIWSFDSGELIKKMFPSYNKK